MSVVSAVLVTGASGFIGRRLVARLISHGTPVVALTRGLTSAFPPGVRVHIGDLATGAGISSALYEGVDTVYHCAGEVTDVSRMHALHVDGTARLLDAVAVRPAARPLRWVQLSSVGAYGPPNQSTDYRWVDEESVEAPRGRYEETKTSSDALVRQADGYDGLAVSLLRPTAVIGREMPNGSIRALASLVRRGWFVYPGPADAIANYVHVDDVVDALLACGNHPNAAGQVFILSSDCRWTALITEMATFIGVKTPVIRMPHRFVRAIAKLAGAVFTPLTEGRVNALSGRTSYSSKKIAEMLGVRPTRPLPGAIRDVLGGER